MIFLGWYSLSYVACSIILTTVNDKKSTGKLKLMTLIAGLPMIFYISRTLGLL